MKTKENTLTGKNDQKKVTSFNITKSVLDKFYDKIGYYSRSKKVEELIIDFLKEKKSKGDANHPQEPQPAKSRFSN